MEAAGRPQPGCLASGEGTHHAVLGPWASPKSKGSFSHDTPPWPPEGTPGWPVWGTGSWDPTDKEGKEAPGSGNGAKRAGRGGWAGGRGALAAGSLDPSCLSQRNEENKEGPAREAAGSRHRGTGDLGAQASCLEQAGRRGGICSRMGSGVTCTAPSLLGRGPMRLAPSRLFP